MIYLPPAALSGVLDGVADKFASWFVVVGEISGTGVSVIVDDVDAFSVTTAVVTDDGTVDVTVDVCAFNNAKNRAKIFNKCENHVWN